MYIYHLATTGAISFSDFLVTTDLVSQVSETTQLRARLRAVLKQNRAHTSASSAATKRSSSNDDIRSTPVDAAGGSDWVTIVKTIEEYLPHVLGVFNCVQTDDLIVRYEPVFCWRTSISTSRFRGPQRIHVAGLHYELASTLLTYALTLSNLAATTVQALGWFERDRSISDDDRKAKDDRLRWAADTLCRASGILLYLSQELLPKWRDHAGHIEALPLDLTTEATLALSNICLAEAQALAIRKLLSPSVRRAVDTVTPGPPLEKRHPSASLLAKLHLNVVEQLQSAVGLFNTVRDRAKPGGLARVVRSAKPNQPAGDVRLSPNHQHQHHLSRRISPTNHLPPNTIPPPTPANHKNLLNKLKLATTNHHNPCVSGPHHASHSFSSSTPTTSVPNSNRVHPDLDVAPALLKYLAFCITFHRSIAYKWLAIDTAESASRIGDAIALLSLSSNLLSSCDKDLSITISSSPLLPKFTTKKSGVVYQELSTIHHWLESYRQLNHTVWFQPVPSTAEVQAKTPAGRAVLTHKPFTLPIPSYGPGSHAYKSRQGAVGLALDQLHLLEDDHPARTSLMALESASVNKTDGAYAAQGAYY